MNKNLKLILFALGSIAIGIGIGLLFPATPSGAAPITPLYGGGTGVSTATKGSLLVGPGGALTAAYLQLAVGTDGQALLASSTATTGLAWGTAAAGAGGSNTQLQYNNTGTLAGISALTWSGTLLQNTATTTLATTTISTLTVSKTTTLATTTISGTLSVTGVASLNGFTNNGNGTTTNLSVTALSVCSNGVITTTGGVIACNGSAFLTGNQSITLSGDVSGSGATAITTAIGNGKVTNAMLVSNILGSGNIGTNAIWNGGNALTQGKLIDNGTVMGMNATSSTIGFNLQGTAGTNTIFNVASSTGLSLFQITPAGLASGTTLTLAGIPVKATFDKSFQIASATLDTFNFSFSSATTTWQLWNPSYPVTLVKLYCKTDAGNVNVGFGTSSPLTSLMCSSTGASSTPSINFGTEQDINGYVGSSASSPNRVRVTATFQSQ